MHTIDTGRHRKGTAKSCSILTHNRLYRSNTLSVVPSRRPRSYSTSRTHTTHTRVTGTLGLLNSSRRHPSTPHRTAGSLCPCQPSHPLTHTRISPITHPCILRSLPHRRRQPISTPPRTTLTRPTVPRGDYGSRASHRRIQSRITRLGRLALTILPSRHGASTRISSRSHVGPALARTSSTYMDSPLVYTRDHLQTHWNSHYRLVVSFAQSTRSRSARQLAREQRNRVIAESPRACAGNRTPGAD